MKRQSHAVLGYVEKEFDKHIKMGGTMRLVGNLVPEHARSQVKGGHRSGEIELIHVGFPN